MADIEKALSKVELCGGFIVLSQDPKLLYKLSFNGSKCYKMFQPSFLSTFDAVWKNVCKVESNNTNYGQLKAQQKEVWISFIALLSYF